MDAALEKTTSVSASWFSWSYAEIAVTCAAALLVLLLVRNSFRKEKLKLPPGPRRWPVIGNLLSLAKSQPMHQTFTELAKQFGPIVYLEVGAFRIVVVSTAELEKEVLETQDHILASRGGNIFSEVVLYDQDVIFAPLGEKFRKLRKIMVVELLNPKRLQQSKESRRQEAARAVKRLLDEGRGGTPLRLDFRVSDMTFNYITRMVINKTFYGHKMYGAKEETESTDFHRLMASVTSVSPVGLGDSFPWLRKFDLDGYEKLMWKLRFQFDSFLDKVIEEHRVKDVTDKGTENMDFVDVLLQLQNDKTNEAHGFSDDVIKALLIDMLIGGVDTSTNSILWAMALLMKHPRVLKKLQQELDDVVGKERLVDEGDVESLPYFRAFTYEALRLHPGAPITVPHQPTHPTKLAGYDIPLNSKVIVNIYALNRDPRLWENPLEFFPERFVDSPLDHKGKHFEFRPFGTGRRMCPGMNLAMILFQFTIAQFLHTCEFSLPAGMKPEDVSLEEKFCATTQMAYPLEVVVSPRLPHHVYTEAGIELLQ